MPQSIKRIIKIIKYINPLQVKGTFLLFVYIVAGFLSDHL